MDNRAIVERFFVRLNKEEKEKIQSRTIKYARISLFGLSKVSEIDVVEFKLNDEHYGIEAREALESFNLRSFTSLPGLPSIFVGVVNLRGNILPVLNLKKFLGLEENEINSRGEVIVLGGKDFEVGILTDEIVGIKEINLNSLTKDLTGFGENLTKFLKGIDREGLILLDVQKLVESPSLIIKTED